MSRPKNKEENILKAAAGVFFDKGFQDASMQDIASMAGLGKGTIYEYFKNKDELFVETIQYYAQQMLSEVKDKVLSKSSFLDMLNEIVAFSQEMAKEGINLIKFLEAGSLLSLSPEAKENTHRVFLHMKEQSQQMYVLILGKGIEEGKVEVKDLEFAASIIGGTVGGYLGDRLQKEYLKVLSVDEDRQKERKKLISLILYGIAPRQKRMEVR